MQLNYRLELPHWKEFVFKAHRRTTRMTPTAQVVAGLVGGIAVFAMLFGLAWLLSEEEPQFGGFALGVLISFSLQFALFSVQVRRSLKIDGVILGDRQLNIDDGVLVTKGTHDRVEYGWPAFDGLEVYTKTIVLWTEPASGVIVPRTAFDCQQEEQEFIDNVKAKIGSAA